MLIIGIVGVEGFVFIFVSSVIRSFFYGNVSVVVFNEWCYGVYWYRFFVVLFRYYK